MYRGLTSAEGGLARASDIIDIDPADYEVAEVLRRKPPYCGIAIGVLVRVLDCQLGLADAAQAGNRICFQLGNDAGIVILQAVRNWFELCVSAREMAVSEGNAPANRKSIA